jgi:hypothetical protein
MHHMEKLTCIFFQIYYINNKIFAFNAPGTELEKFTAHIITVVS